MRRGRFLFLLFLAATLPAGTAAALPAAPKPTARPAAVPRTPPLNFSGVWELDAAASRGVPPNMREAVLSITQTGHRILLEPVQEGKHLLLAADQIVADGKTYEKIIGPDPKGGNTKGYVTASWSPDRASLRLEIAAGPAANPRTSVQRSIWSLSRDRKVWVRQSVTVREGQTSSTRLVFRRKK